MRDTTQKAEDIARKTAAVSFSIRLTDKQRELLKLAAEQKEWSVTGLLKTAALEKAAHIVNVGKPRLSVDFGGVAREVAEQVFRARSAYLADLDPDTGVMEREAFVTDNPHDVYESMVEAGCSAEEIAELMDRAVNVSPDAKGATFLEDLRQAVRYGGTEFLDQVLQASERIVGKEAGSLEGPVDPSTGE
ncbi:MAG: hypothetical protein AB7I25_12390 [Vicinamibacterales bacterium]